MKNYDLKVGYACNNNCIHCVVKTNYLKKNDVRGNSKEKNKAKELNFTYKKIIECLNSKEAKYADMITITGGEPTVRKDFIHIVRYISTQYPSKKISIQTNGRNLKQYINELKEINSNIFFTIALHSTNMDVHNFITNNKIQQNENPYLETIESIKETIKYFRETTSLEVVLSKYNYKDIENLLYFVKNNNIKTIRFSFPHLDGLFAVDKEYALENFVGFEIMKPYIGKILDFAKENPTQRIFAEGIPFCMIYNNEELFLDNIIFESNENINLGYVQYPNENESINFNKNEMFSKKINCTNCIMNKYCLGTWTEALSLFPNDNFIPLTKKG